MSVGPRSGRLSCRAARVAGSLESEVHNRGMTALSCVAIGIAFLLAVSLLIFAGALLGWVIPWILERSRKPKPESESTSEPESRPRPGESDSPRNTD